jgi:hypothetical protein
MSDDEDYFDDEWEGMYDDGFGAQAVNPPYFPCLIQELTLYRMISQSTASPHHLPSTTTRKELSRTIAIWKANYWSISTSTTTMTQAL